MIFKEDLDYEREDAHAAGLAEGLVEGLAEGLEQGLEQGRIDSLRPMIREHIPVSTIRRMGYSDEEILKATGQSGRE